VKGGSDTSGFSKFEVKKKRQQTDKVSAVKSIFRKTVAQAGKSSEDDLHGIIDVVYLRDF